VLRQLAKLTKRVPAAGPNAVAIAVYSDTTGESFGARETGVEGVACVDDAARGFVLLAGLWGRTGNKTLKLWADGLLEFVVWMHAGDGRWVNFIYDWDGTKNLAGPTSAPGLNFWQARATDALATAALLSDQAELRGILDAAFAAAAQSSVPANVRAIHALAAVELLGSEANPWLLSKLHSWCEEILACSIDGVLMNSPDEGGRPHLWGHIQEGVLSAAAGRLARPDLTARATRSADVVFGPAIESGFTLPHVQPYDVQSAVFVMDKLFAETGHARYQTAAARSREWFGGRNTAQAPVYMRDEGRVADGVDAGTVSRDSGAEANISAGLALIDDPFVLALASSWPGLPAGA
jgi:hypothetical protein